MQAHERKTYAKSPQDRPEVSLPGLHSFSHSPAVGCIGIDFDLQVFQILSNLGKGWHAVLAAYEDSLA